MSQVPLTIDIAMIQEVPNMLLVVHANIYRLAQWVKLLGISYICA